MSAFTVTNGQIEKIGIWTGDIVKSGGRRFRVDKIAQVNYKCTAEDGSKWNVRITPSVVKDEDQSWDGPKEKNPWELANEAAQLGLVLGSTVKLKSATMRRKYGADQVWVVIAKAGDGTMRLTKLGGWGDTYLRKITADMVEVVTV